MKRGLVALLAMVMLISALLCALPFSSAAAEKFDKALSIVEGKEYLIVCTGQTISDKTSQKFTKCLLKSVQATNNHGLAYGQQGNEPYAKEDLWIFEAAGGSDQYYMKSAATGKYLTMKPAGTGDSDGHGYATMETAKQALTVTGNGNIWKISANLGGRMYYIRFTNIHDVSVWEAGASDSSNKFAFFCEGGAEAQVPKADPEYKNTTKPLFKVVTFGDPHVDYGIQSWSTPIRKSSISSAEFVRDTLGAADIALVAGDMTSNNGRNTWSKALFDKVQKTMFDTFAKATKDGKVLFVAGNHENEAGINSDNSWYSGDWSDIMETRNGKFTAELYFNDMGKGTSRFNEQLCYRYTVKNMEFIGINTPYRTTRSNGYIYLKQVEWVEQQMKSIGKDKTVVLLCHYPLNYIDTAPGDASGAARNKMVSVLETYPNAIWAYGHIHGDDNQFTWVNTSELVKPSGTAKLLSNNAYEVNSYINAHCGSMGYYGNMFNNYSGLQATEPGINQLLVMEFYSDHITFRYYNTGEKTAIDGVREIASYTVMRDMTAQLGGTVPTDTDTGSDTDTGTVTDIGTVTDTDTVTDSGTATDSLSGSDIVITDVTTLPSSVGSEIVIPINGEDSQGFPAWALAVIVASGVVVAGAAVAVWYFILRKK